MLNFLSKRDIILIVLSMTLEELHNSFKDFYYFFDKNTDLYFSKDEFFGVIQY